VKADPGVLSINVKSVIEESRCGIAVRHRGSVKLLHDPVRAGVVVVPLKSPPIVVAESICRWRGGSATPHTTKRMCALPPNRAAILTDTRVGDRDTTRLFLHNTFYVYDKTTGQRFHNRITEFSTRPSKLLIPTRNKGGATVCISANGTKQRHRLGPVERRRHVPDHPLRIAGPYTRPIICFYPRNCTPATNSGTVMRWECSQMITHHAKAKFFGPNMPEV